MGGKLVAANLRGSAVPFHVTLYVNTRCNLRCVYCSLPDQRENEVTAGVAAALAQACRHSCATCFNPCILETNSLFAMHPGAIASLARTYLLRTTLD